MARACRVIIGNWKMYGGRDLLRSLLPEICTAVPRIPGVEVVACPPAVWLTEAVAAVEGTPVKIGAQDCHVLPEGAHTGDVSAAMLREAGCTYVIVGHSERRAAYGETDAGVRAKAEQALMAGLIPVICVGETLEQREAGRALDIVGAQVAECLPREGAEGHFLLAYEPVWAIGSGRTPSSADIHDMHRHIAQCCARAGLARGANFPILYGGSVKSANAREILAIPGVRGALAGGASLKAQEFGVIMAAAAAAAEGE